MNRLLLLIPLLLALLFTNGCGTTSGSKRTGYSKDAMMYQCIQQGMISKCETAKQKGLTAREYRSGGNSALGLCIDRKRCSVDVLKWILANGGNKSQTWYYKQKGRWWDRDAVHASAGKDRIKFIQYLSTLPDWNPNQLSRSGWAPLAYAQSYDMYHLLVNSGADTNKMSKNLKTGAWNKQNLVWYFAGRDEKLALELLDTNIYAANHKVAGKSTLIRAAKAGHEKLVKALIAKGANINDKEPKTYKNYKTLLANAKSKKEAAKRKKYAKAYYRTIKFSGGEYKGQARKRGKIYQPYGKGTFVNKHKVKVISDEWQNFSSANGVSISLPDYWGIIYKFKADRLTNYNIAGKVTYTKHNKSLEKRGMKSASLAFTNVRLSHDIRILKSYRFNSREIGTPKLPQGYMGLIDNQGRKQGWGRFVTPGNQVYFGGFKDDLFHGNGSKFYYSKDDSFSGNYFKSFKVGAGSRSTKGFTRQAHYKLGQEEGWIKYGKTLYRAQQTSKNRRTLHPIGWNGVIEDVKNGKIIKSYDFSKAANYTLCETSNLMWNKVIQVPGNSCTRAKTGFYPSGSKRLKNLKLRGPAPYKIINADIETLFGKATTAGYYRNGVGHLVLRDFRTLKPYWMGSVKNHKKHGKGFCEYNKQLEPCEMNVGRRIDDLYHSRILAAKIKAEQDKQKKCTRGYNKGISKIDKLANFGLGKCDRYLNKQQNALNTVIRKTNCAACGQRPFKRAGGNVSDCVKEKRRSLRYMSKPSSYMQVGPSCVSRQEARSLDSEFRTLKRQVVKDLASIESSSQRLRAEYKRIIWPKLDAIENRKNARIMGMINAVERSARNIMRQRQKIHNQQMGNIRQRQQIQRKVKQRQKTFQNRMATQQRKNQYTKTRMARLPRAKRDPYAAMEASCKKRGLKFLGDRCEVKTPTITFPGRACYDPSGKTCKTGETIYYNSKNGQYESGITRSDQSIKNTTHSGTSSDNGISSNGNGKSKNGKNGSNHGNKTVEKGAIKVESIAYCWPNKKNTKWLCHGPTQRTLIFGKLDGELDLVGCGKTNKSRRKTFKDGHLYYCELSLESYSDDVATIYNVPASYLQARNQYQCKKGRSYCRDKVGSF